MVYATVKAVTGGNFVARNASYVAFAHVGFTANTATTTYYAVNDNDGSTSFGAWLYTLNDLTESFSNAKSFANNQVVFKNMNDLVSAFRDLDYWYNGDYGRGSNPYEVLLNMGKTIKVGVAGLGNELVTFTLVKRTTDNPGDGYGTYWIVTDNRLSQQLKVDTSDWYGNAADHSVYGYSLGEVQVSRI